MQNINVGTIPDSHTGDTLFVAFTKVNDNFNELIANDVFLSGQVISITGSLASINSSLSGKSDIGHTHLISDINNLQNILNNKVDYSAYNSTISIINSNINQIQSELNLKVEEAPLDGQQYARKNAGWTVVTGGGGGTNTSEQIITAGENLSAGNLVYLKNDGKYYKASNAAEVTSSTELRITLGTINLNATGNSLIEGEVTTSGLTAGDKYYVGTNGDYTNVLPTIDGSIIRYIGTALSTTKLEFNPDQTYFEIGEETFVADTYVTGGTYNAGTAVFTNNTGGTFSVTGFSTGGGGGSTTFTGGTVTGPTTFTNGLTANTITKSGGTVNDILLANGTTKKVGELRRFINSTGYGTGYTASGSLQKIFNTLATDVSFDVISGRSYTYKLHMSVSSMPATSNPVFFGFMGTSDGNFSVVSNAYRTTSTTPNTAWGHTYHYNCSFGNNYNVYTAANTTSQLFAIIEGVFDCGVTGNLYPCIGSSLFSSTTLLNPNSWFEIIELTNNQTNTNN